MLIISAPGNGYINMEYWDDGFSGEPEEEHIDVKDFGSEDLINFVEEKI